MFSSERHSFRTEETSSPPPAAFEEGMMISKGIKLVAIAVAAAEISTAFIATPARAQSAAQERKEIRRQQQVILQQQKLIAQNQQLIEAQQRQLLRAPFGDRGPVVDQRNLPKGLSSLFGCPSGYNYLLSAGCVPAISVQ